MAKTALALKRSRMFQSRASSMPMLFDCPASLRGEVSVGTVPEEAARAGSAVHMAMQAVVQRRTPDLTAIANRFKVDLDELSRLTWYGRRAWRELAPSFPEPETEQRVCARFPGVEIVGHIDLRSRNGSTTNMADWKSGRIDRDYYNQFAPYAAGEMAENPHCERVVFSGIWLRENEIETYVFTREDIAEWGELLVSKLATPNHFRTGPECRFCPRSIDCPALMGQVRRDVEMFSAEEAGAMLNGATADQLIAIRRRANLVASFAESVTKLIRSRIEIAGKLVGSDGTTLELAPSNGPRKVDVNRAWPILQKRLTDEEMAECVHVSASKAEALVGEKQPYGAKAGAIRAFAAELEAAGAVTRTTIYKLKEGRPPRTKEITK